MIKPKRFDSEEDQEQKEKLAEEEWRKIVGPDLEIEWQLQVQSELECEQESEWQEEQRKQELAEEEWRKIVVRYIEEQKKQLEIEWQLKEQREQEIGEEIFWNTSVDVQEEWRKAQIEELGNGELEQQKEQRRLELEEEDWRKEHQVSSELGDYDLLQYRCEEELETGPDDFVEDEHSRVLRFATLEMIEPQSTQEDQAYQANLLRVLLMVNGGKMRAEDARREMHLTKELFSLLLASMGEYIETKPYRLDETELVIILKSNIFTS
jgi:hypothetical protein